MNPVVDICDLKVRIKSPGREILAISGVDLSIGAGEIVALVGESGSGKTLTAFSILRLLPPALEIAGGSIRLAGEDVLGMDERQLRALRGQGASIVFQEPMTSLNPLMTVGRQVREMLLAHGRVSVQAADTRVRELLELVRIPDAARRMREYPHSLSGGLRQRVMSAMAIACEPKLLIADEPTTALDVTVQAQILALLADLRDRLGMALLLITPDLGVVAEIADRVLVMYAGRIVEQAPVEELFRSPRHPYTRALMQCRPDGSHMVGRLVAIGGLPPTPGDLPAGCAFAPRCPQAGDLCRQGVPALKPHGAAAVACHFPIGP
jgi:oligopeptide/dipeptide ABC transporter ATP-binding protein